MVQALLPQLQTFDANGYLSAFRQGEQDFLARSQRETRASIGRIANDQGFLAGQRAALETGDMDWATRLQQMDTTQQARVYDTLGRLASAADTPERWNTMITQMRARFGAGAVQGFEDFGARNNAIRISMTAAENLAEQHRRAQLGEQRRFHDAQIAHLRAQDRRLDDRSAIDLENVELRRRQLDAQNLSRDRGFTLQSLTALSRSRTPEEFQLVAQTLRPFLGRVPRFEERDRLIQSAMDSLEEFDMVPDENGRPSRVSRGWSPMVLAAIGPSGVGAPAGQPQAAPAPPPQRPVNPNAIMDAMVDITPMMSRLNARANLPGVPRLDIPVNPSLQDAPAGALNQALPGAPPQQQASPGQPVARPLQAPGMVVAPPAAGPAQLPPGVAMMAGDGAPAIAGPIGMGRPPVVQVAAPGGLPPGVVAPQGGASVPVQGRRPNAGVMAGQQAMIEEIEQQYGAPNTWGQNGAPAPPFSVVQRYYRAARGGRPPQGYDYGSDGSLVAIGGAPQRGGGRGGDGGGNTATANARRLIPDVINRLDITGAYLQSTSVPGQVIDSYGGPLSMWAGGGRFQQAQADYGEATRIVMTALSGATNTIREFEHYNSMFTPRPTDTAEVRLLKHNRVTGALRTLMGVTGDFTDENLADFRRYLRRHTQDYYGVSASDMARFQTRGGQAPGTQQQTGTPGSPRPATGGWGGAGGVSTQDLLNGLR